MSARWPVALLLLSAALLAGSASARPAEQSAVPASPESAEQPAVVADAPSRSPRTLFLATQPRQLQPQQKPRKRKKSRPESKIYFIKLPATPYSYVPGLGYVSQPPSLAMSSLATAASQPRPLQSAEAPAHRREQPILRLPLEFLSNGKPTSVYRYPGTASAASPSLDSRLYRLRGGPYAFNGRPNALFRLLGDGTRLPVAERRRAPR